MRAPGVDVWTKGQSVVEGRQQAGAMCACLHIVTSIMMTMVAIITTSIFFVGPFFMVGIFRGGERGAYISLLEI